MADLDKFRQNETEADRTRKLEELREQLAEVIADFESRIADLEAA